MIIVDYFLVPIYLFVYILLFIIINRVYIRTSTMAAVMSLGIFIQGVLLNYFGTQFFQGSYGKTLCIIVLAMWFSFILSIFLAYLDRKFKEIHYSNPINRFGMGTWVAGTSICWILFHKQFSQLGFISEIMVFINLLFWIIYISISLKTLIELQRKKSFKNVHGILLLTTVSTQSIVLLINTVFNELPAIINILLLFIGFSFYMICALFILHRYMTSSWSIESDWNNTNCILHGALSISGLACLITGIINEEIIQMIWGLSLFIFIIVEAIEIYRLIRRIRHYGLKRGILIYDVTQWSRVFTFAMFYTFTSKIETDFSIVLILKNIIQTLGIWVIVPLLMMELILWKQKDVSLLPKKAEEPSM